MHFNSEFDNCHHYGEIIEKTLKCNVKTPEHGNRVKKQFGGSEDVAQKSHFCNI